MCCFIVFYCVLCVLLLVHKKAKKHAFTHQDLQFSFARHFISLSSCKWLVLQFDADAF